jgi:hypothetical protein
MMILIIASAGDRAAGDLAANWREADARLVRPADLSEPGWRHFVGSARGGGAIALGGEVIPEEQITGVLTRLLWIDPAELGNVVAVDKEYAASEMSAFLLSWLSALECPVVNRPMPGCLAGPPWRAAQWIAAATLAGVRTVPLGEMMRSAAHARVTVVGGQCFGAVAAELRAGSRQLGDLAGVDLLEVAFDRDAADAAFLGANTFPPLDDEVVRTAVLGLLKGPSRRTKGFPDLRPWRRAQRG